MYARERRLTTTWNAVLQQQGFPCVGINPASISHLFEPFYTTKPRGMGMGLAVARSIIKAHGGQLSARRNPDRGSTFEIVLRTLEDGVAR